MAKLISTLSSFYRGPADAQLTTVIRKKKISWMSKYQFIILQSTQYIIKHQNGFYLAVFARLTRGCRTLVTIQTFLCIALPPVKFFNSVKRLKFGIKKSLFGKIYYIQIFYFYQLGLKKKNVLGTSSDAVLLRESLYMFLKTIH